MAGVVFGLALVAAFALDRHRPSANAFLSVDLQSSGIFASLSSARRSQGISPLEAELRALIIRSEESGNRGGQAIALTLRIPVPATACPELEGRFRGSCDGTVDSPLRQPENLTVQSEGTPLQVSLEPEGVGFVRLSQPAASAGQSPSEWSLVNLARESRAEITCLPKTPLILSGPEGSSRVRCSPDEALFTMRILSAMSSPLTYHLNGVHWLRVHLRGKIGRAIFEEGVLTLADDEVPIHSTPPERIGIHGAGSDLVTLDLVAPGPDSTSQLSLEAPGAEQVEAKNHQLPSWLDSHARAVDLILGALAGIFASALFNFIHLRRRKR